MPRKLMDDKMWSELQRHLHNQGIVEFRTKNLSEEEEQRDIKGMFEYVWKAGFTHIHTLKIVPLDSDRQPYYVHVDDINRK
jgi:hypothetical protein